MKLLSNLENLDNIVDGENKKLDIHYMDFSLYNSQNNPLIYNELALGLYINTNGAKGKLYLKRSIDSAGVYSCSEAFYDSLLVTQNIDTAQSPDPVGYLKYIAIVSGVANDEYAQSSTSTLIRNDDNTAGITVSSTTSTGYISPNIYTSAYCTSTSSAKAKTANCNNYKRVAGSYILITMINNNTAQSAITLNINSTTAKPIYINGEPSSATNYTLPAAQYIIYFDGTNYYFNTDGTIPRVIHGDDSIKRIVEIDYEDYKELEDNNEVDPNTEYHIPESGSSGSIETIVRQLIQEDAERKHPIGSLEFNVSGTNPNTYLGFGTWELWGAGKVPVGIDTNDTDFNTSEKSGGSKTASTSYTPAGVNSGAAVNAHTYTPAGVNTGGSVSAHSYTPAGKNTGTAVTLNAVDLTHSGGAVQSHTLTIAEMPTHSHTFTMTPNSHDATWVGGGVQRFFYDVNTTTDSDSYVYSAMGATGSGGGHSHGFTQPNKHSFTPTTKTVTNPTFTGTAATLSHTVTQPTFTGTQATLSHTVTQPTFSGTAATITESTVQPYITCYMWKRTA